MSSFGIGLHCAGVAENLFHTREKAGDWRRAGVGEMQRAGQTGRSPDGLCIPKVELQRSELISKFGFEPICVDSRAHATENMKSLPGQGSCGLISLCPSILQ
jgi:hypothetical protein